MRIAENVQRALPKRPTSKPQAVVKAAGDQRVASSDYDRVAALLGAGDRERLAALEARGTLDQRDSTGKTLLEQLSAVAALDVPAGAPYTARQVLAQLVGHLADPQQVKQEDHNTCGPTTVQYLLLTRQPAEYARLVAGLLGGKGQVKLQGGQTAARVPDSLARDCSNRDDLNRVLQAALIDQGGHLRGKYSNLDDHFHADSWKHPLQKLGNLVAGWFGGNFGIGETSEKRLFEQVLGLSAHTVGDVPFTDLLLPKFLRDRAYGQVVAAVQAGKTVAADIVYSDLHDSPGAQEEHVIDRAKVGYAEAMKSHQILVTKIADGKVYYRNPWGYETFMSQKEFQSRLQDGVIAS